MPLSAQVEQVRRRVLSFLRGRHWTPVSLGQNCNVAWYLQQSGTRQFAGPFDWIFSSASIVADCLRDDFACFLDRAAMFPVRDGTAAGHRVYHASMFNHRSPLNAVEDHLALVRSVDRFRALLQPGVAALFVCNLINEPEKRLGWTRGFVQGHALPRDQGASTYAAVVQAIRARNPTARFVFIDHRTQAAAPALGIVMEDATSLTLRFDATGGNDGVKYLVPAEDEAMTQVFASLSGERPVQLA